MPETSYYGGIQSIVKDSVGRIWYNGTDAFFMYDGNSFYQLNDLISNKFPQSHWFYGYFLADKAGRLFFSTNQGLLRFNYEKFEFDFTLKGNIRSIALNNDGTIWMLKDDSIKSYSPETSTFKTYSSSSSLTNIVCANGDVYCGSDDGNIYRIDEDTKQILLFIDLGDKNSALRDVLEYNGMVYILTHMNGLFLSDKTGKIKEHYNIPFDSDRSIISKKLYLDSSDVIWIASLSGLFLLDPNTKETGLLRSNLNDAYSLPNNSIWTIYPDPDEGVWISTYGGKFAYSTFFDNNVRYVNATPGGLNHSVVSSFEEDKDGNIWIGTEGGGLNYWERKKDTFTHYLHSGNNSINSNSIKNLRFNGAKDIMYISAFNGGLVQYNTNSDRFTDMRIYYPDTNQQLNVYDHVLDGDSGIWVTDPDNTIFYKDKKKDKTIIYPLFDSEGKRKEVQIESLYIDEENNLHLVTHQGLFVVDAKSHKIINHFYLEDQPYSVNNLCCYCITSRSDIWLGTLGGGVNLLSKDGSYKNFNSKNGFPPKMVFGILEDTESKDVWFSTSDGIYFYSDKEKEFTKAGISNHCGAFYIRSCYKTSKGEMLFGGTNGFIMFTPGKIKYNQQKPNTFFTDFFINNNRITPDSKDSPIRKDISTLSYEEGKGDKIILSHKQSNIEIRFSSNSYLQSDKNKYVYKMSGLSDDWQIVNQGQKSVQFFNLPAGEYVFEVKSANNDGLWSDKVSALYFYIKPSPFLSVWAYIIYTILLLALAYLIWRYFTNKKIFRHRLEVEQIKDRNMRELTQARINFFTNISHDLKTPLTLVLDPLKQLKEHFSGNQSSQAYVSLIEKNVVRIQHIISQLLQFREIESQKITLNLQSGDLIKYIKDVFSLFELYANKKEIETSVSSYTDNLYATFDYDIIEKIFTNLFSNAVKYTPDKGYIGIKIYETIPEEIEDLKNKDTESKYISIEVANTGTEIGADKKDLLFKSFNRLSSQKPSFEESTGLGLAIVKELVDALSGKIIMASETDKVSFTVMLPLILKLDVIENESVSYDYTISEIDNILVESEEINLSTKQNRKANSIIIIEDDPNLRMYMEQRLSEYYNVYTAADGLEGITKTEKIYPQVVISDLMMPKFNGFDVCRSLRSNFKTSHIPIIVISALGDEVQNKVKALEAGASLFIDKPFDMDYLLQQVNNIIKNQGELKELYSKKYIAEPSKITISSMDEDLLKRAMKCIELNISNPDYDVESFVSDMNIGRTLLYQKINDIVGMSIKEFILNIRLKRSAYLLTESDLTIAEIAYSTGFNNAKYFSICFKKQFEVTPTEFKRRAAKED